MMRMHVLHRHSRLRAGTRRTLRRGWLRFAALAIGCQFLVPTGYMPGSLANGTPFVLCDMFTSTPAQHHAMDTASATGMGAMHADMPEMASAEHEDHGGAEAWENCPLGALGFAAALAFAIEPGIAPLRGDQISTSLAALPRGISLLTARARAPPASAIQPNA